MPTAFPDAVLARRGVGGGARLRYEASDSGTTRLSEQWVRPPLHLSKAYHADGWALSLLTSPTAGLLDGDLLEVDATLEPGARAALISPAACRVHTMNSGFARVEQRYKVGAGAVLDVWPAPLILQRNSSVRQTTQLNVDSNATVLFCEIVTPGRAAFGEAFEFTEWRSNLRIYRDSVLLAYENFSCRPEGGDVADWRQRFPSGSYASLYCLSPEPLRELVQSIHDLDVADSRIGASPLRSGGLGVKILAGDGISLRKAIFSVRNLLIDHTNTSFPQALQRAQTFFN